MYFFSSFCLRGKRKERSTKKRRKTRNCFLCPLGIRLNWYCGQARILKNIRHSRTSHLNKMPERHRGCPFNRGFLFFFCFSFFFSLPRKQREEEIEVNKKQILKQTPHSFFKYSITNVFILKNYPLPWRGV